MATHAPGVDGQRRGLLHQHRRRCRTRQFRILITPSKTPGDALRTEKYSFLAIPSLGNRHDFHQIIHRPAPTQDTRKLRLVARLLLVHDCHTGCLRRRQHPLYASVVPAPRGRLGPLSTRPRWEVSSHHGHHHGLQRRGWGQYQHRHSPFPRTTGISVEAPTTSPREAPRRVSYRAWRVCVRVLDCQSATCEGPCVGRRLLSAPRVHRHMDHAGAATCHDSRVGPVPEAAAPKDTFGPWCPSDGLGQDCTTRHGLRGLVEETDVRDTPWWGVDPSFQDAGWGFGF